MILLINPMLSTPTIVWRGAFVQLPNAACSWHTHTHSKRERSFSLHCCIICQTFHEQNQEKATHMCMCGGDEHVHESDMSYWETANKLLCRLIISTNWRLMQKRCAVWNAFGQRMLSAVFAKLCMPVISIQTCWEFLGGFGQTSTGWIAYA